VAGLAALFSQLGWGEGLANFVMLLLLVAVAIFVVRFVLRRFAGGAQPAPRSSLAMAGAAASGGGAMQRSSAPSVQIGSALRPPLPARPALPADFDAEGFERLAKMLFIRMQAANDAADLNDLRNFTTPELFVSVRYTGALREAEAAAGTAPTPFDEVWHLVKPEDDSRPWAIAGIQQTDTAAA
jgi:predicted lipid-binding transport protein (Tim44 family)